MADIYEASKAQTTASQREALAALARGGTAERDAYLAAKQAQQGDQQRIMAEILARATAIGAPAGAANEQQAAAQPGFDRRSFALAGAQGSADTAMQQISAANSNYFDQVNAAVPLVKARSDEIREANRIKAEQAEQERLLQLQLKELALMQSEASLANTMASGRNADARARASAAKSAGGGDLSDSELKNRLLGAARVEKASTPPRRANVLGVKIPLPKGSDESVGRRIGVQAGVDSSRVFGLLPDPKAKASSPRQATHRANVLKRLAQHASPGTVDALQRTVAQAGTLAEALTLIADTPDADLKANKVARDKLVTWVRDYYAV